MLMSSTPGEAGLLFPNVPPGEAGHPLGQAIRIEDLKQWQVSVAIDARWAFIPMMDWSLESSAWFEGAGGSIFHIPEYGDIHPGGDGLWKYWSQLRMDPERVLRIWKYYTEYGHKQTGVFDGLAFMETTAEMQHDPLAYGMHVGRERFIVPESPTLMLCSMGVMGLLGWRRR